jgi:hypothetical protein
MVYQLTYYDDLLKEKGLIQSLQRFQLAVIRYELMDQSARYKNIKLKEFLEATLNELP